MAIGDITLSSAAQANLAALQNTAKLLQQTQAHLSTGKTVNSASDNATAYFASRGFLNSANSLNTVKGNLSTAIEAVNSFDNSLSSITDIVNQLQGLCTQALSTSNETTREGLAAQYNALCIQLDELVNDASFNGTNLLNSTTNSLTVYFNADNSTYLTIQGQNVMTSSLLNTTQTNAAAGSGAGTTGATAQYTSDGTNLNALGAESGWSTAGAYTSDGSLSGQEQDSNSLDVTVDQMIKNDQARLLTALSTLTTAAATFGGNATLIQTRQDFTSNMITSLTNASNSLVSADTNTEGAYLQALQAQSSLGIVSLGVSGTLASAILRIL